ncbi:MAG: MFS transporter [Nocardioides sp.]|uniref:MFS transporter n=1 Tax=Nocardioides sp. TaxID=35761 RepID=UPI003F02E430
MSRARWGVALAFALNGLCFATWVSRIPEARASFDLSNGALGLLLLAVALGSTVALPLTGAAISRFGSRPVVRFGVVAAAVGLLLCASALGHSLPLAAVGLACFGLGLGVWDVAMNTEGTVVERLAGRAMMPRFHAVFSLGTVIGAVAGAGLVAAGVPALVHLGVVALIALAVVLRASSWFLDDHGLGEEGTPAAWRAWLEPRTLLIGVMVMALALTEGTANDWLAVALVDGHDASHATGVAGFALFVAAMTLSRWFGVGVLDRYGRPVVLWATMAIAAAGVLLLVLADHPVLVGAGIVLWGTGASLGFPVGMSAAGDDPRHAAARLSVVSTIGYTAFLAGPPLLGFLADHVGTLDALLVVAVVLVPAALAVPAARKPAAAV